MQTVEHREKSSENIYKQISSEHDLEKKDLLKKIAFLSSEMEKIRSEKGDELALRVQMENKVRVLDRDIVGKMGKFEQLVKELEESRSLLRRFENNAKQQAQDLEYKNQELETVRRELAELWTTHNQLTDHSGQQADLIRQIHCLQSDTQKMMKNQEDAHSMETTSVQQMYTELTGRYDQSKKMEAELRQQVLGLKKVLLDKDDVISEMQGKVDKVPSSHGRDHSGSFLDTVEPVLDLEFKVNSMLKEIDNLRCKLLEKDRRIDDLEEDVINQTIEFDVVRLNRHERTHSTPSREFRSIGLGPMKNDPDPPARGHRSRSMSPTRRDQPRQRYHIQKDLDDTTTILKLKMKELGELKKAHGKRLERLKSVQENYRNVKEQLKTVEAEYYGSKKKQKKAKRADPKDLRHEDSSAVWNELAYFKNENRTLVADRMALEEEVDTLRVKSSEDMATIHELKVSLDQERDERAYEKKKTNRETEGTATLKSEVTLLKSEVQNKAVVLERLERDLQDIRGDRDVLIEDKRQLKQEMMDLKQDSAQHRMDQADLKRDIHRLKRELQEEKAISKLNASRAVAAPTVKTVIVKPAAKRRKKTTVSRGQPHKKMVEVRDDEDWEELSETSDHDEEDSLETGTDTLGRNIVKRSRFSREDDSDPAGLKMQRTVPMKQTSRARRPATRPYPTHHSHCPCTCICSATRACRDAGTSPILKEVSPIPVVRRSPPGSAAALRQLKPMKQRVGYLQQQVITLRESRTAALKAVEELKEVNTQLQADLNLANQRMRMSKQSIQKLMSDIEKMSMEKGQLESRLLMKPDLGQLDPTHSDHDWKVLESRLKSSTNELSRQSAAVRQLKQENEAANEQIRQLHDKVSRVERDNNQKRTLLDDQRTRVKQALENAKADADSLEALETRTKLIQDVSEKQKIQIESYKKRLGAVTREKREYEEKFLKLAAEVDKKNKLLLDSQSRRMDLESTLSQMESMATQQMKSLARESEDALEAARDKLREIQQVLQSYQRFVKTLSNELLRRVVQARVAFKAETSKKSETSKSNASLQRAQDLAKDILNLSQSDLDEIMSADGDAAVKQDTDQVVERRRDKKWAKKLDRLQNSNDDFALSLVDLFIQKIEERNELTAKLHSCRPTDQSDSRVQVS